MQIFTSPVAALLLSISEHKEQKNQHDTDKKLHAFQTRQYYRTQIPSNHSQVCWRWTYWVFDYLKAMLKLWNENERWW